MSDFDRPRITPEGKSFVYEEVEIRKASTNVVQVVCDALRDQLYPEGYRLPSMPALAKQIGVSRLVVREALKLLESAGVVELRRGHNGGTFVASLGGIPRALSLVTRTPGADLRQIHDAREVLEIYAAVSVSYSGDSKLMTRLSDQIDSMRRSKETPGSFYEQAVLFHFLIASGCANAVVARFLRQTIDAMSVEGFRLRQRASVQAEYVNHAYAIHVRMHRAIRLRRVPQIASAVAEQMDLSRKQFGIVRYGPRLDWRRTTAGFAPGRR